MVATHNIYRCKGAEVHLTAPISDTLVLADTDYLLTGFTDGASNRFTVDGVSGTITYDHTISGRYLFNGSANFYTSKNATITFELKRNGTPVIGCTTPVYSAHAGEYMPISATQIVWVNPGDVFTAVARSSIAANDIIVASLNMTFWE